MILNTSDLFTGRSYTSHIKKIPLVPIHSKLINDTLISIVYILYILLLIAAAIIICPFGTLYKSLSLCSVKGGKKRAFSWNVKEKQEVMKSLWKLQYL